MSTSWWRWRKSRGISKVTWVIVWEPLMSDIFMPIHLTHLFTAGTQYIFRGTVNRVIHAKFWALHLDALAHSCSKRPQNSRIQSSSGHLMVSIYALIYSQCGVTLHPSAGSSAIGSISHQILSSHIRLQPSNTNTDCLIDLNITEMTPSVINYQGLACVWEHIQIPRSLLCSLSATPLLHPQLFLQSCLRTNSRRLGSSQVSLWVLWVWLCWKRAAAFGQLPPSK